MTETRSTCPYCGVGCGVLIQSEGGQITGVRGDPDHPANFGKLCTKGSTLHLTAAPAITRQARLLQPMQRLQRGQAPVALGWDAALDRVAGEFGRIVRDHGPDAVGFYISGQLLTEDYYVFNKLAKGLIGTNNVDTNSRLCMSSAVAGYKLTLGADAPPACYDDVNHAACLFIVGSNAAYAHPILFRRIEAAKQKNPGMKVIVADPRRTDTAELADLYLPLQPGTDVMLFHGLLHVMLWEGWTDNAYIAAHTNGFDELKALVRDCTPDLVAQTCGISKEDLFKAARWFAGLDGQGFAHRRPTLSLYCQGLNQSSSGTAKNASLINLHLATGQIGKPGAGPFSLTGQPNAMGGREVGGLANLLSAHRDLANPAHRAEVAALWGVADVPSKPGKTAVEMFQAAADGEIKALWIACTNPAQSMPDQATVRRALQRAEFVVVQEAFATASTCDFADILLPATTWGEKEGTVTNSERRISRVRAAVPAAGEARHDWRIAVDVARRLEAQLRPGQASLFPYETPEAIWNEHRESTRSRDLDITGLSYAMLEADGPQQWPLREGDQAGKTRLYEDGIFPTTDGKARFAALPYRPTAEQRESRFPFSLTTGRLRDHWHGMTRTGTLGRLFGHVAEPSVQMNPQDMERRGLKDGELVHVTSKRGSIVLPAQGSRTVHTTQAFIAMHWGPEYLSGRSSQGEPLAGVNAITTSACCPTSKQPELKHAAVKVLKAELPWTLLGVAWLPEASALTALTELRALMPSFEFASCVPFGRERTGVLFRAAAHEAPEPALVERIEALLGLSTPDTLRYADKRRQQRRSARLQRCGDDITLEAFLLAGDTSAEGWIKTLLQDELPAGRYGRLLLMPGAAAPVAVVAKSPQVCTCFNVGEDAIRGALPRCGGTDDQRLAQLQGQLKCGTNCGSCIPELRRLVKAVPASLVAI
ncbi:nitrate reductase [Hydrogenophaga pseudoflava]|uniref:nitrate reductase n=1 Tax=Hydrogenophaga pseudoflava TaxID=47421 RepID=UPI001056F8C9|nr:nitrate reductase [Hydrogenophaga pseudoflava]